MTPSYSRLFPVVVWVFCLAFLSVGARNFEEGLSMDGPCYATIARQIATTGEWFRLDAGVDDFRPYFAEHPHLGLWLVALVFKLAPIADWSARIVGHLFYVFFLLLFYLYVRWKSEEKTACLSVFLLWTWFQFSNIFSNVYLDPGCLFFGTLSVALADVGTRRQKLTWMGAAGFSIGLCFLYKGLTVLGFLPLIVWVVVTGTPSRKFLFSAMGLYFTCSLTVVGIYLFVLKTSSVPDFLSVYWQRQMTNRFNKIRSFQNLFHPPYWENLVRYTYYLAPLALLATRHFRRKRELLLPALASLVFIGMYASVALTGGQYLLYVMPWLAWLIAEELLQWIPLQCEGFRKVTGGFAIGLLFLVQYIPMRTHANRLEQEYQVVRQLSEQGKSTLFLGMDAYPTPPFLFASVYTWYGKVNTHYAQSVPDAREDGQFLESKTTQREAALRSQGWCLFQTFAHRRLWTACPQ